jgi:hypothetical protein
MPETDEPAVGPVDDLEPMPLSPTADDIAYGEADDSGEEEQESSEW